MTESGHYLTELRNKKYQLHHDFTYLATSDPLELDPKMPQSSGTL